MKIHDLTDKAFGRLVALRDTGKRYQRNVIWLCRCACGSLVEVPGRALSNGNTRSCGCLKIDTLASKNHRHGDAYRGRPKRLYRCWQSMRARCYRKLDIDYKYYGAKGICVCSGWNDYLVFKGWALSHGYSDNLTLDRIDSRGNYKPSNCQWITKSENSIKRNREH
jgi:hypothetical protein